MNRPPVRIFFIAILLYAAYFAGTLLFADYIFPPARQSLVFQNDVLSGAVTVGSPKVLIMGDSTAAFGYSAGRLPNTLSLAVFSGSFAEMYYALVRYLSKFDPPHCLVLTASYNWEYHRDNRFWDIYVLGGYYTPAELAEIYRTSREVGDFPAREYSEPIFFLKATLYWLRLMGVHMTDVQNALFEHTLYKSNAKFHHLMRENAGSINKSNQIFPFIWEPHAHLGAPFSAAPLYDKYLERLVKLANERGIRVRWVQSPISRQVYTDAAVKFYEDMNAHLKPIVLSDARNTYDGEVKIFEDNEMFSATHLNTVGAQKFTESQRHIFEECQ